MSDSSPLSKVGKLIGRQTAPIEPTTLGRFQLKRVLGKGAQSVVWLAFDPHLEREVAIKLMKVRPNANPLEVSQWLQEARSVSRLAHANVVPLFEADVHGQQPYLVFEHVEGKTLAAVLRQSGAMPVLQAVSLMIEVLDALVVAHAAGVIHRDLKPSNVMIDLSGRARVMDFGIAARASREDGAMLTTIDGGTPGYLSPEAMQRGAASPLMDVFSAGIVLTEMLSGQALIAEKDPAKAVQKVLHEQLTLPKALAPEANDALRAILLRAIQRDPQLRHPSAQLFRDELVKWSGLAQGAPDPAAEHPAGHTTNSTLEFLLRRMRHKSDFPALSDSIVRIQGMANSETESVGSVTNEILKDVALTNKLLKLVNSAHFGGGGRISTVSRAVSLVGFNGIRNMALSLVLLEHMQDKAHANVLKEEFLRALLAGTIASQLSTGNQASEEAFIGTMFQNLGRLLAEFYFAEEAATVRTLVANPRQPVTEGTASANVLGMGYEALGLAVAKVWGLPEVIQTCLHKPAGMPPLRAPVEPVQRLRWLAAAANEVSDILLRTPAAQVDAKVAQVAMAYTATLGVSLKEMQSATLLARQKFIDMATAMDVKVQPTSAAARLLKPPPIAADGGQKDESPADSLDSLALHATALESPQSMPVKTADDRHVAEILAAGIQDITNAMVEDFKLTDVLRMILETMFRAMAFQRVVFCMRDPKTDALTGRFGLGKGIETLAKSFVISLKSTTPDLFSAVCQKGADTMISDAGEARIASRLPAWYLKSVDAPTFLLLPLTIKTKPFGLIYADKAEKGGMVLDDKELALLRTLRNQAVMAFRQSS
jgi:eukaryotic-like serine/threonine-protein kinase